MMWQDINVSNLEIREQNFSITFLRSLESTAQLSLDDCVFMIAPKEK